MGEGPVLALNRELQEEIGILPLATKFLGSSDVSIVASASVLRRHLFAVLEWDGGNPAMTCDEHAELRWFSSSDLTVERSLAFKSIIDAAGLAVAFARSKRG